MRVIHGVWAHGTLCLWAEDPDLPPASRPGPGDAGRPPHPFACQASELADLLTGAPGRAGEAARKAVEAELTLRLPSVGSRSGSRPLASPELIRPDAGEPESSGPRGSSARVRLADWRMPALAFEPAVAMDMLAAPGHPRPGTGDFPPRTRQIRADLRDDRLTVAIGADSPGGHTWAISPPPHVCEQLRRYRGLAISLTTKALPALLAPEDLPGAFNDPEAIVGWVNLASPPQPRRRPAIRLPWPRNPHSAETPSPDIDQTTQ